MADAVKEYVRFGLKNAHYAVWDAATKEYGAPKRVPGSVKLSLSPEGSTTTFHADDHAYYTVSANGGYSGSFEVAAVPDDMLVDVLGYVRDASGMVIEDATATPKTFALLFEVDSDQLPTRYAFYNCTMARPSDEHNTKGDSVDVDTQSFDLTAISRSLPYGTGATIDAVKAHLELTPETKAKYDAWFTEVNLPTKAAA